MAGIKMAKAKVSEIDNAIKLAHLTDAVCNCSSFEYPEFPVEHDDDTPITFDVDCPASLRMFYDRVSKLSGGLMRVAFGYGVLVDNCCDPTKDVLELKPGLMHLEEAEMKAIEAFRAAHMKYVEAYSALQDSKKEIPINPLTYAECNSLRNQAFCNRNLRACELAMLLIKTEESK